MKRTYDAEFFEGKCPYTDKPCNEWECDTCEIEAQEKKDAEELDRAESVGYGMSEVKIGQVIVDSYGISKVVKLDGWGGYTTEQIIPKEVFIEAYNKYIKAESGEQE